MSTTLGPGYWKLVDQIERGKRVRLKMSEQQFLDWADDETRAEWVDGEVIVMSPPSIEHGGINNWLRTLLDHYVERKRLGRVYGPEASIRLTIGKRRRRRVPDILFLSRSRLDAVQRNHIEGPPDLIVEIVSPESISRDWREKYLEYEAAGVREYWVIDPASQRVEVYALDRSKKYRLIETMDRIASSVVRGFYIEPGWLWADPRPSVLDLLPKLGIK